MQRKRHTVGFFLSSVQSMGGAVRVVVSLANRMVNDVDVVIIELTEHRSEAFPIDTRVAIVSLGSQKERIRGRIPEVKTLMGAYLAAHPLDMIFGIGVEETVVAMLPCHRAKVPLVFCDHGALINQLDDTSTTLLRYICCRVCAKTVVLTSQTEEDYRRIMHIPAGKLVCIPNWIPNELLNRNLACDINSKQILWAGRLDSEKGIDHLFEIAKRVMPRMPGWTWDLYGEAVLNNSKFDLQEQLDRAHLTDQVRLCGKYADTGDVFPYYSIGTLTSYREGLPLFLLEGLAYRMPLISFDIDTGPRDLIDDGKNGYLIQPYDYDAYADRLIALMQDKEQRKNMSGFAHEKIQGFTEDAIYEKWCELLCSILVSF